MARPERGQEVRGGPLRGSQVHGGALATVQGYDALSPVQVHGWVRPVQADGGLPFVLVHGRTYGCVQGRALVGFQQRRTRPCAVG